MEGFEPLRFERPARHSEVPEAMLRFLLMLPCAGSVLQESRRGSRLFDGFRLCWFKEWCPPRSEGARMRSAGEPCRARKNPSVL